MVGVKTLQLPRQFHLERHFGNTLRENLQTKIKLTAKMVLEVSYHRLTGILILVIGLSEALPTGSPSQSDLPNLEGSEPSESAVDSESNQTEQPPTDLAWENAMENPYLYGGDMLGGLGFGNRTFSVRALFL